MLYLVASLSAKSKDVLREYGVMLYAVIFHQIISYYAIIAIVQRLLTPEGVHIRLLWIYQNQNVLL